MPTSLRFLSVSRAPCMPTIPLGVDLDQNLYALDSTTIDLCLSLFPWARFRRHKAAVKMHTLLDLHGNIPTFIRITEGKTHDVNILDEIIPEAGAFYVMDRGYIDFERLYLLHAVFRILCCAHKENVLLQTTLLSSRGQEHRRALRSHCHSHRHRIGQSVSGCVTPRHYTSISKTKKRLKFLTNNFVFPHLRSRNLQVTLAGGTVLQIDQTAPADQGVLWHQRERREDPDLDRGVRLRARRDRSQAPAAGSRAFTRFYRFSVSRFLKKCPFYRPSKRSDSQNELGGDATN